MVPEFALALTATLTVYFFSLLWSATHGEGSEVLPMQKRAT